jgi:hypothetical protein
MPSTNRLPKTIAGLAALIRCDRRRREADLLSAVPLQ